MVHIVRDMVELGLIGIRMSGLCRALLPENILDNATNANEIATNLSDFFKVCSRS